MFLKPLINPKPSAILVFIVFCVVFCLFPLVQFKTDSVFENWKIYPNPVLESATLNIPFPDSEHLTIRMFSSNGELIKEFGHVHPPVFNFNKVPKPAATLGPKCAM